MARTKQTARKYGGGGKPRRQQPPSPSDTRPTGKAHLEALRRLGEQSQNPAASQQTGAVVAEGTHRSISDTRTAPSDLGIDLLQRIFAKLGPHPKDLVSLGVVSKQWRQILNESTWKELCLKHAGGLVEELGYNHGADGAPGGWAGLYKLLVYCPGCHFPTFEPVLQSDALSENYEWRHGWGHVQAATDGFCEGKEVKEALHLATPDEVVISRPCSHVRAVDMCNMHEASAPPVLACRGFVKHFESSKLAELSGASAFLSQRIEAEGMLSGPAESLGLGSDMAKGVAASNLEESGEAGDEEDLDEENASSIDDSEGYSSVSRSESEAGGVASSTRAEPKDKGSSCLYCDGRTFALPREAFGSEFSDYDDLLSESFSDAYDRHEQGRSMYGSEASDDDPDDSKFVLGTGFVCLSGHIVLGMAGYPKSVKSIVPQLAESMRLQRPQAVEFLLRFVVGLVSRHREGHHFIQGLKLDQLIQVEARLVQLKEVWPVKGNEETDGYKLFGYIYGRRDSPVGIVDVLEAGVPADLLKCLQAFILTGNPSLAESKRLLLEAFATHERKREEEKARGMRSNAIYEALQQAGFTPASVPHPQSMTAYIEDPSTISIEEVIAQQRDAREQSGKCKGITDGRLCTNQAAKGCSNGGCRNC